MAKALASEDNPAKARKRLQAGDLGDVGCGEKASTGSFGRKEPTLILNPKKHKPQLRIPKTATLEPTA